MPARISDNRVGKKRKRSDDSSTSEPISDILLLEDQVLESRQNYNHIVTLLDYAKKDDLQEDAAKSTLASVALCRVFCKMMVLGNMSTTRRTSENEVSVVQWLKERYLDYKDRLLHCLSEENTGRQITALALLMRLVKQEAQHIQSAEEPDLRKGTFASILEHLISSQTAAEARDEIVEKYLERYDDLRFQIFAILRCDLSHYIPCGGSCMY